jgi:hypothetical protein
MFLFGLALIPVVGCGGGPDLATVSGKVTYDGKPLENATVGFYPLGAHSDILSSGRTNANGEYSLTVVGSGKSGAVVGDHRVSISVEPEQAGTSDLPADKQAKTRPTRIPSKYQGSESQLKCTVPSGGKKDADFELKSK